MKLTIETEYRKVTVEATDHSNAGEMLDMFITAMIGVTFAKETVIDEMKSYIEEYEYENTTTSKD